MRDPRSIAEQVDGLISSAEETERGVKDLEEILTDDDESALLGTFGDDIEAELRQGRAAARRTRCRTRRRRRASAWRTRRAPPPPPPPRKKITH